MFEQHYVASLVAIASPTVVMTTSWQNQPGRATGVNRAQPAGFSTPSTTVVAQIHLWQEHIWCTVFCSTAWVQPVPPPTLLAGLGMHAFCAGVRRQTTPHQTPMELL